MKSNFAEIYLNAFYLKFRAATYLMEQGTFWESRH